MPEISRFFGIIISMYYNEEKHHLPHYHARYNEFKATIAIDGNQILEGNLPPRVYGLIVEWSSLHKEELMINWNQLKEKKPVNKIQPLA